MSRIIVTPAGRERYMKILVKHLISQKDYFDTWQIWANTKNMSDLYYFQTLADKYSWIDVKKIENDPSIGSITTICLFFKFACEPDNVYLRLDDDIVYLSPNFIKEMFEERIRLKDPFLLYANIINNANISYLHIQNGLVKYPFPALYRCMDPIGWGDPFFAETLHETFIKDVESGKLAVWKTTFKNNRVLHNFERVSINCVAWLGSDFAEFNGNVDQEEEEWLACVKPRQLNRPNQIYGNAICAHFAFGTQREYLDTTNLLQRYEMLLENNTSHKIKKQIKIGIYQGCLNAHFEMSGYVISFCKEYGYEFVLFSANSDWDDYYAKQFGTFVQLDPIMFVFHKNKFDVVFVLTDDDPFIKAEQDGEGKYILIDHFHKIRNNFNNIHIGVRFFPSEPRQYAIPCYDAISLAEKQSLTNKIEICCIGVSGISYKPNFYKTLFGNYNIHLICRKFEKVISPEENVFLHEDIGTNELMELMRICTHILFIHEPSIKHAADYEFKGMCGALPLAFSYGCKILMPDTYQYDFKSVRKYSLNEVINDLSIDQYKQELSTIFKERDELIRHRNDTFNDAINTLLPSVQETKSVKPKKECIVPEPDKREVIIVVARYKEDLTWLRHLLNLHPTYRAIVHNDGPDLQMDLTSITVIKGDQFPCESTKYIASLKEFSKFDIKDDIQIVFLQGDAVYHNPTLILCFPFPTCDYQNLSLWGHPPPWTGCGHLIEVPVGQGFEAHDMMDNRMCGMLFDDPFWKTFANKAISVSYLCNLFGVPIPNFPVKKSFAACFGTRLSKIKTIHETTWNKINDFLTLGCPYTKHCTVKDRAIYMEYFWAVLFD